MIIIYTDGACKGNGKQGDSAGGFGVFIQYPDNTTRHIWGGDPAATNNRMELLGAITALERTPADIPVQLWTDSSYVKDGITKWIKGWKAKGWKKADGKPVLNQDLWQTLDTLCQKRQIDWQWLKGHAGLHGNEMADSLANKGVVSMGDELFAHDGTPLPLAYLDTMTFTQSSSNQVSNQTNVNQAQFQPQKLTTQNTMISPAFTPLLPTPTATNKPRQLILDTETTGFDPVSGDRIVEIGAIEMIDRKATGKTLHIYLNPEKIMDDDVIKVHGITNDFVADKPKFAEVAEQIYTFLKGAEIIAHNAPFDMKFLIAEFAKAGYVNFAQEVGVFDTLELAKTQYPNQRNSLDHLVKRLNVGKKDRIFHGALLDSEILMEVYLAMTGGQGDLMAFNDPTPSAKPTPKPTAFLSSGQTEQNPLYDGDTSKANPHFVAILPPPINKNAPERQLIMDTETTGFDPASGDRIVEVGIIELVGRKFTGEKLHVYINPEKEMDDDVIRVHGISNEFVADKPKFAEVAQKVYDFMAGAEIIAHNASFDMKFLTAEFDKVGLKDFAKVVSVTDSLALAKERYPGQKNSLDALVKRLDVGKKDRTFHGALLDSEILAEVYLAMTGGQVSLGIDDIKEETTEQVQIGDEDLSSLAHLLIRTKHGNEADMAWRASVLG